MRDYEIRFEFDVPKKLTRCEVKIRGMERIYGAIAYCHPKDQFNRSTGRKVCLAKAIRQLHKEIRTAIWEQYFQSIKADKFLGLINLGIEKGFISFIGDEK